MGAGSEVGIDRWSAWQSPNVGGGAGYAVAGCIGLDLGAWTDEAAPIAFDRLDGAAASVAYRLDPTAGFTTRREQTVGPVVVHDIATGSGAEAHTVAKTFLGFVSALGRPRLRGCFVLCAPTTSACEEQVAAATATGFVAPPPAGSLLRATAVAIHHPRTVAGLGVTLFFALGVVAVWTRPRPRRK